MRIRPSSFRERPKTTAAVAATEVDAEKGRIERDKIRERERGEEHKSRLVVVARSAVGRMADVTCDFIVGCVWE